MLSFSLAEARQLWISRVTDRGNILIWIIASLAFSVAGPFGAYDYEAWRFAPAWFVIVGVSLLIASVIMTLREVAFADASPMRAEAISCTVFAATFGPLLRVILGVATGDETAPLSLVACIFSAFVVAVPISALRLGVGIPGAPPSAERPTAGPRLLARLGGDEGPVLRISGKDHFVEVVTAQDTHSLRMRLADAVAEMDAVDGFFTHRSHWVARAAIRDVERAGARHFIVSEDEERIPVSRPNLPKLEEAGLV
ncbi:MAG: LytTR family DNA-binding domain-containing protein [Pseudomonadota bacterium]